MNNIEKKIKDNTEDYNDYTYMIDKVQKELEELKQKIITLDFDNEKEKDAEVIEVNNKTIKEYNNLFNKRFHHLSLMKISKKEIAKTIRKLKKELKIASKSIENGAKHETDR